MFSNILLALFYYFTLCSSDFSIKSYSRKTEKKVCVDFFGGTVNNYRLLLFLRPTGAEHKICPSMNKERKYKCNISSLFNEGQMILCSRSIDDTINTSVLLIIRDVNHYN